jgi:hypothetical protein
MHAGSITVINHSGLKSAFTAISMTGMLTLSYMLLVNFVTDLDIAFTFDSNRADYTKILGGQTTQYAV